MFETTSRSLAKTITWRIVGSSAVLCISFVLTGSITTASTIALTQLIVNTLLYFIHERIWNKITWGIYTK